MPDNLRETDWKLLLERIDRRECTPFLGAGACYGTLPLGSAIAQDWARSEAFPFDDQHSDLAKVAQFLSVTYDAVHPKDRIIRQFRGVTAPDFDEPCEPHRVLSELPLPIYITTNYDDFLFQALKRTQYAPGLMKNPRREICEWNTRVRAKRAARNRSRRMECDPQNPIVFHLHGHTELPESMVLTEDDYLDFLIKIGRDDDLLPPRIQEAFTSTSLLFVGYSLNDWNFRVLFRSVVGYLEKSTKRAHISVQLAPLKESATDQQRKNAEHYLNKYFDKWDTRVYWGTAREFAESLKTHWEAFQQSSHRTNGN
jgi:hypothetical protein